MDGRLQGGMQFGILFGVLLEVPVAARAHFYEIDGRELFGALFGGCCWGCWCTNVGMFFAIWGPCWCIFRKHPCWGSLDERETNQWLGSLVCVPPLLLDGFHVGFAFTIGQQGIPALHANSGKRLASEPNPVELGKKLRPTQCPA